MQFNDKGGNLLSSKSFTAFQSGFHLVRVVRIEEREQRGVRAARSSANRFEQPRGVISN